MDADFDGSGGFGAAGAVCKECLVIFLVGADKANDVSADEEAFGGYMYADLFVTATDSLQKYLAGREIDLDIKVSLLADEIFFFDPDRGHDKPDAGAAYVGGFAHYAWRYSVFT